MASSAGRSAKASQAQVQATKFARIREATVIDPPRRPTKPSKAAKARRVDAKQRRGSIKAGRGKVKVD